METKVTPKDFFAWAGAMLAFYWAVGAFVSLLFTYINHAYPDALSYDYSDPYSGSMRFAMASLIVLLPVALILLRMIRNDIKLYSGKEDLWVRRWALVLTLFLAGLALVVDLIMLVNTFLGGELTTRFIFKVVTVVLVAVGVFLHFLADMRGYWMEEPKKANMIGYAVALLVAATIGSGFLIMGSPAQVRLVRFDDQKVSDLQTIQWQIINYYQTKGKLPATLQETYDPISGSIIPVDPQGGVYKYSVKAPLMFELCATFNKDGGSMNGYTQPMYDVKTAGDITMLPWYHGTGESCFERTIDPERYPQFKQ